MRQALGRLTAWKIATLPSLRRPPDRLLVAPTDLRAADPFVAEEIAEGRFPLAGRLLVSEGRSPFFLELPSKEFANRLHGFSWLRHVRASRNDAHAAIARRLTDEWLSAHGRQMSGFVWEPGLAAQRLIAWLSHSTVLLKNTDMAFYKRFLRSISDHVRYLEAMTASSADGLPRLTARIALAMASLATPTSPKRVAKAAEFLDVELERQILADGGHFSRNPRAGLEILLDLLPLRQTYVNLGHDLPARLVPTIDRMFPALRFFRHQGGELALFNGATSTLARELMSVLRYDETAGAPFKALPHMGYQRLSAGSAVVLMDVGLPSSPDMSREAHAGCLSFELSSGKHRFIINSGSPHFAGDHYRQLARATAAHSTLTLNDTSSARMVKKRSEGAPFLEGLNEVKLRRHDGDEGGQAVAAAHDGYVGLFGLVHERTISINSTGALLRGKDRLRNADGSDVGEDRLDKASIRFHIHPQIEIRRIDENEVRLVAPDGEQWTFVCMDAEVLIEDDVFFADPSGVRASRMLELSYTAGLLPEIQWVLTHRGPG